jgi:transposase
MDFIERLTWEVIDCNTQEGNRRYKEISAPRASNCRKTDRSSGLSPSQSQDVHFLSKEILNERDRRFFGGFLARIIGSGGIQKAASLTGLDKKTIQRGKKELIERAKLKQSRIRCEGGGRPAKAQVEPLFERELLNLIEDELAGDPMNEKRWVRKTLRWMKKELRKKGIIASISTIWKTLKKHEISLKKNRKSKSTQDHPNRTEQFRYLNELKRIFLDLGKPVISIDAKKKEIIGNFKNDGRTWRKKPIEVLDHDFPNLGIGKLVPYGIYDLNNNKGQVYCGTSFETSEFAVDCICEWWEEYGRDLYLNQSELLILCDSGGSNGYRRRMWKWDLQTKLADRLGLVVHVCHYPSGASKYNPIERKMFSFISKNWAGEPLTSIKKALSFIRSTKTESGLEVGATLIEKEYEKELKVTNEQMESLNIKHAKTCPRWNYCIRAR